MADQTPAAITEVPAAAVAMLLQATAQALANAAHNATTAQQHANVLLQATTTQGVALLYGIDTASVSVGIAKELQSA